MRQQHPIPTAKPLPVKQPQKTDVAKVEEEGSAGLLTTQCC